MSYRSLSGGRLTLVDLRGKTGVSDEGIGAASGKFGLLGGVTNVGVAGELGFVMSPTPCG